MPNPNRGKVSYHQQPREITKSSKADEDKMSTDTARTFKLIKFIHARYTNEFQAGKIRMGSVAGYRNNDELDQGCRQDPKENLGAVYQGDKIVVTINGLQVGEIAGPMEVRQEIDNISYLLSMVAITDQNPRASYGSLQLDPRLGALGDKAVIVTNVTEFQKRLKSAIDGRGDLGSHPGLGNRASGFVEYVDLAIHHGDIGPFRKSVAFAFQHEWRLALLDRNERGLDEIFLEVGDLTDITMVVDSRKLLAKSKLP